MHLTTSSWLNLTLALLYLFDAASATSLSRFEPKTSGLTGQCQTVYTQDIAGCSDNDFQATSSCSQACLTGLVAIGNQINTACRGASVTSDSIIGLFLNGQGIQVLCNVAVVTTTTGKTSATTSSTSSGDAAVASSTVAATTLQSSSAPSSSSSGSVSSTSAASTDSSSPSSSSSSVSTTKATLMASASSTVAGTSSTSETSTSSGDSPTATDQVSVRNGNVHSGGGSPFDNITNSEAASLQLSWLGGLVTLLVFGMQVWFN